MRDFADQALSLGSSATQSGHIRANTGFINENQMLRLQRRLVLTPNVARRFDVRTILLGGVLFFLKGDLMASGTTPQAGKTFHQSIGRFQPRLDLRQGHIRFSFDRGQHQSL